MRALLEEYGYVLDFKNNIWISPDYEGIAYNDGDEVETRIASIIQKTSDISVLSTELRPHCTDWPSLYHLSGTRSNVMRPFENFIKGDVLEIGAGCGAITRYLGECGANVLALEGSPRRAAIARSRTRDLDNVTVLAEKFDQFHCDHQFDVVTLIGVFEYANLFTSGDNPQRIMLERVHALLKPNGKLIIAIENQLGLKYFAGAPEDHLGQPMIGIEGRYQKNQPQTFGRDVLKNMLEQAAFSTSEFLAPFPDYKLPVSIVTEEGFSNKNFDAAAFAWASSRRDPQLPSYCNFSLELAWPEIFQNGLGLDVANSFLIIASPSAKQLISTDILAYHYSVDRIPEYCKETLFIVRDDDDIRVDCRRLGKLDASVGKENKSPIKFNFPESEKYVLGTPLSYEFVRIVTKDGWSFDQVARFVWRYLSIMETFAKSAGLQVTTTSPYAELNGDLFDVIPQNIIILENGKPAFIDKEWQLASSIELGHLLFRSLLSLTGLITRFGRPASQASMTLYQFMDGVFTAAGLGLQEKDYARYITLEVDIQQSVTGRKTDGFLAWGKDQLQTLNLSQALTLRDAQVASQAQMLDDEKRAHQSHIIQFEETKAEEQKRYQSHLAEEQTHLAEEKKRYESHILELEKAVGAEQLNCSNLNNQLAAIKASRFWRLRTRAYRAATTIRSAPKSLLMRMLNLYRRLPIGAAKKQKIKGVLFRTFGFALQRRELYRSWKVQQEIENNWPVNNLAQMGQPGTRAEGGAHTTIQHLPVANGVWEWADYDLVKSRIAQVKATRLAQVSPKPMDLIDIGKESFSSAASRVLLPRIVATPDVSIIVPVFNNLKLTLECLLSISRHSSADISYEVIVADDASTDETTQIISSIPNVRLLRNERNLGFLLNCNHALEQVQGKYVLYLNNDVQVTGGWLRALLDTFDAYPNVGAVGPRFVYPSGHLQEAGVAFLPDGTAEMIGLNQDPSHDRFSYVRRVDYVSGACLLLPTTLAKQIGGFSEEFLPCYCEDSDLCLSVQHAGYDVYYNPDSTIVHHLSKTTGAVDDSFKMRCIYKNLNTLQNKWHDRLEKSIDPKLIAFYLPQFHPMPENDKWWGTGFTEWTNVSKAHPNFVGHYQPRLPADLGYYDLRLSEVMEQQAELARRYGVQGFCFYYYWFDGKRLLDRPIEQMLESGKPDFPFCLCWANENWTRRWDGQDHEILMAQSHSVEDDTAVILDLIRFFRDERYIRIDGRPLLLAYRVTLFPDFAKTAARWRTICREQGIGEIYIAMVESFELVHAKKHPNDFGCDAAVEFPPQGLAQPKEPSGAIVNPDFQGSVADYRDLAVTYSTREAPGYTRFKSASPGWDNSARRQNNSFCFEHATPGAFQAWLEEAIEQTRLQQYGDERLIFVNAWNEWAEGAYLEPDRRFGHTYLEAIKNAFDAARVLKKN